MAVRAILSALLGTALGFLTMGFIATAVLVGALGQRDGGPAMSGFFTFGSIGGVSGALLGVGLALRFSRSPRCGRYLMIAAGALTALTGILLAAVSIPDRGRP